MAINDVDSFLNTDEFGVDCSVGGTAFVGILDSPVEVIAGGVALSREYELLAKTSDVSSVTRGTTVVVNSENYTCREAKAIDDGLFTALLLSKD
jgi:hypothetical protein